MVRSDIDRPAADVDAVEEDLPVDPIEVQDASTAIVDDAVAVPVAAFEQVPKHAVALPTAAERAFDLFDAGKLSEAALLAALGVSRDGYAPNEKLAHRALNAVEAGALSEAGLIKVLGS